MKKFNLGLEAIGIQTDDFFYKLSQEFKELKSKKWRNDEAANNIEKLVKSRFNLNVRLRIGDEMGCCMWPPNFNQNHIFHQNNFKQAYQQWGQLDNAYEKLEKMNAFNKASTIDIKNAKLYGLFSELTTIINMSPEQTRTLDENEVTAVFLHEVGHAFTWYENIVRINTTNFVLLELSDVVSKNKTKEEKIIYLKKAEDYNMLRYGSADELVKCDTASQAMVVYLSEFITKNKSASNTYFYDTVTCEQMADQFVSRLGGGRHLLTGLDHLNKKWGTKVNDYHDAWVSDIVSTLTLFGLGSWIGIILGTAVSTFIVTAFFIPAFMILVTYMAGTGKRDHTYDDDKVRLTRMRNDLIAILKTNPPENVKKHLIKEIELCDDVLVTYVDYKSMLIKVSDFIFKTNRNANKVYELQRDLEMINFNPLFVKSQKLSLV